MPDVPGARPRRRRVLPVLQLSQTECGLCCVLMILRFHGVRETFFALRRILDVGRDGTSLAQMRAVLAARGFRTRLFRANPTGLARLATPYVAFWEDHHFVVVERLGGGGVTVVDPAVGRRRLTLQEFTAGFSGVVLHAEDTGSVDRRVERLPSPWLRFLRPLLRSRAAVAGVLALSLALYLLTLGVPLFVERALDRQLRAGGPDLPFLLTGLLGGAAVYLGLALVRVSVATLLTVRLGREVMESTFGHLLRLPYAFFSTRSPGDLLYRLGTVNAVRDTLAGQLVTSALDLGMMVVIVAYMLFRAPLLTLVMLGFLAVILLVLVASRARVAEAVQHENTELNRSQSLQLEAVMAIASVKQSGTEQQVLDRWRVGYGRSLVRTRARSLLQGRVDTTVSLVQLAAPLVMLFVGLTLVRQDRIGIGTAVALQALSATFFGLAASVFGSYTQALVVGTFLDRLHDILATEPEPERSGGIPGPLSGRIEVRRASYAYTSSAPPVLREVSFSMRPGDKVGVVGRSGCGKSTLGKLLSGLLTPVTGAVLFDGEPRDRHERTSFHRSVGYVPQEIVLENRSIRDNITLGAEVGQAEVEAAAAAAQVHEEIVAMRMGYHTIVAELGANLSGGQRQRIALARALLARPSVLVLDEATSSLDRLSEARIADGLRSRDCTRVVIAHRLSTVMDADLILVMADGEVVERGTHDELLAAGGAYADLFRAQLAPVS